MKLLLSTFLMLSFFFGASTAFADVYVKGYIKKDGTYVAPHYRSNPNSSQYDNWSTKGNVNPYTGKKGYKNPDKNYNSKWPNNNFNNKYKRGY